MDSPPSKMDTTSTDCTSAEKMKQQEPSVQDASNDVCKEIVNFNNSCAPQEAINAIAPPLPVIYGVLPNFSRQDTNALAPLKGLPKGDIVRHASQSTTHDGPQPKCRKILFGLDETTRMDYKEKIQQRVASTTSMASFNEEMKSTEEENEEHQPCMSMAEMSTRPLICLPHIPERYACKQYFLICMERDNTSSDDNDNEDILHNSGDEYCASRNINFDDDCKNLFSNAEHKKSDAASNVNIVLNNDLRVLSSNPDNSSLPVRNVVEASISADVDEEDSEAEYDQPRLLPENYVAPRRQRIRSYLGSGQNPLIRRRLVFDNVDDDNHHHNLKIRRKRRISTSTAVSSTRIPQEWQLRHVRRRLFDSGASLLQYIDLYDFTQSPIYSCVNDPAKQSSNNDSFSHCSFNNDSSSECSHSNDSTSPCSQISDSSSPCSQNTDSSSECSQNNDSSSPCSQNTDSSSECSQISDSSSPCSQNTDSSSECSQNNDSSSPCSQNTDSSSECSHNDSCSSCSNTNDSSSPRSQGNNSSSQCNNNDSFTQSSLNSSSSEQTESTTVPHQKNQF